MSSKDKKDTNKKDTSKKAQPTVRDVTHKLLRDLGMTTVFGNPGSTELDFLTDWPEDFRYILAMQEASAIGIADGYSRVTKNASYINLHSAAGLGNALGNIFTAQKNQTPMVVTAGQQARSLLLDEAYLAAERASEFPRPHVKFSVQPERAQDAPKAILQAYLIAMTPPMGPCFVSIPSDDWNQPADYIHVPKIVPQGMADKASLADAAKKLASSDNIAIIAGSELGIYNGFNELVTLAETLQAPVFAAPVSHECVFPEDHPQFAGFLSAIPEGAAQKLADFELILVVGAPAFTFHVPGEFSLGKNAEVIQLSVSSHTLAISSVSSRVPTTGLYGDLAQSLTHLNQSLSSQNVATNKKAPTPLQRDIAKSGEKLSAAYALQTLRRLVPDSVTLVEEAPSHRPTVQQYFPVRRDRGFMTMASGGLGYGLPAAVGVALALKDAGKDPVKERVIAVIGDGSMMYSIQALWTAAEFDLPLTVIVLNNSGYGAMRSFSQLLGYKNVPGISFTGLDFVKLAAGHSITEGWQVDNADDLEKVLTNALTSKHPNLIEIIVDPNQGNIY